MKNFNDCTQKVLLFVIYAEDEARSFSFKAPSFSIISDRSSKTGRKCSNDMSAKSPSLLNMRFAKSFFDKATLSPFGLNTPESMIFG